MHGSKYHTIQAKQDTNKIWINQSRVDHFGKRNWVHERYFEDKWNRVY